MPVRPRLLVPAIGLLLLLGTALPRVVAVQAQRIRLRVGNLEPAEARWNAEGKTNVGHIVLPAEISTGQHALEIIAEDFAHNVSSRQVMIAVGR